jgi:hypothetical protein
MLTTENLAVWRCVHHGETWTTKLKIGPPKNVTYRK